MDPKIQARFDEFKKILSLGFRDPRTLAVSKDYLLYFASGDPKEIQDYIRNFVFLSDIHSEMNRLKSQSPPQEITDLHKKSLLLILKDLKTFATNLFSHLNLSTEKKIQNLAFAIVPKAYRYNRGSWHHRKACDELFMSVNDIPILSARLAFYHTMNQLNLFIEQVHSLPIQRVIHLEKPL